MNSSVSVSYQDVMAQRHQSIDVDLVASAIAGVINSTRAQGRSLEDLTQEVLADDSLLDWELRCLLSDIVAKAWESFPPSCD